MVAVVALLSIAGAAHGLDFPRFMQLRNISEKASDEMLEEERVSEVLNEDASYRSLLQSVQNPDVPLKKFVKPGEDLRYQAQCRGLPAGSIRLYTKRMRELKGRPVFVFDVNFESNDFLSSFYEVKSTINSYVDADNGRSYLIRRQVSERNRFYRDRLEFKYDFVMDNGINDPVSRYSRVEEDGKEKAQQPFPIPGNMQDMVSVIYYIRGSGLAKVGDSCNFLLGGRKKPVLTKITVVAEETVSIPNIGKFDCLIVEPVTDGTNLSGNLVATRGGERVWLEKNTLIPVKVSAEFPKPLGTVVATLIYADKSELTKYGK